jgi:hypothetical protein
MNRGFLPPLIAVDGSGNINLAWTDQFLIPNSDFSFFSVVFFSRSSDGGTTFSPPQNLSGDLKFPPSLSMALDPSGNINLIWESLPHGNVFLARSNDGGGTFSNMQVTPYVQTGSSPTPEGPSMAIDSGGNIDAVWMDNNPGNYSIFFSRSTDGGASFSVAQNLSGSVSGSRSPRIAVDSSGNINVVWDEGTQPGSQVFPSAIFFSRSTDGGGSFSAPQNISNNSGDSFESAIALDSCGNINVAWRDDTPGTVDLFFSRGSVALRPLLNFCVPVAPPGAGHSVGRNRHRVVHR